MSGIVIYHWPHNSQIKFKQLANETRNLFEPSPIQLFLTSKHNCLRAINGEGEVWNLQYLDRDHYVFQALSSAGLYVPVCGTLHGNETDSWTCKAGATC